ncbi:E3 ubiquitin-protein ligase TRIM33-like isoform X1 [Anguilla anguilla]|uniref:E3 ubiquitin-protein ligase TRIM33-like isoform X1 n=1 Tax=Anguilla anguilla TaxID=7936 RepID=UPI0015B02574|nr:E3 ubiquitin-protein ligase TRIM33-like isoform X1 [Anguilla anguilla]
MDAMSSATFSTVEEHCDTAEVSATRPAACFGNCAACGTKLVPDGCPQLLPCLHSLCQKCVCVDRRECPVCGAVYTPTEVIDNLFFKKSQQTTQCGGCGGAGAGGWCVECGEALCPECVSAHKRVKVTREHAVLPQKPPTVSAPTLYCSTHREERVKLICQLCDQATCRECQLTLHRNHRFQFLHEAVAEEKGQIRSVMEDLRLQRQEVRRSLSDLDRRLLDVKDLHNKLNGELRDTILRVRDALLKRAMTLAAEVQEQCGSEKRSVLERQEVLKKLEERQTYLLSFTERALDTEGYSTLLSCRRKIQSQLRDVMSHAVSPGDCMMNLTFHCAQDTYGHMATFGQVVVEKVPFACTNNENAIGKNPHLHKNQTLNSQVFFTTETPPTSSPNPPTYCDNSLTSSHKSAASALSASFQTSRTLNSNTSTHDLTISCHNLPTLSSSQIQTAFSHISTTSSGNPPTSSGNPPTSSLNPSTSSGNPPTSSLNPSTSSAKGPSLSQMLCPSSYRPIGTPAVSHTAISPCHSIADIYNSNLSSRAVMLPCLLSTFPLSLPVALYSVSLNAAPTIPIPLTPNGQMANANTPAIQTSASSPCSQISQTVAQAAILPEAQGSSESMPLDTVVGLAASTEDQTANGTFLAPPVKALADSPCERTPPAGGAQEEPVNPAAAENEPTSTVVEADITECAGDPSEEATPTSDTSSACEIASSRATDDSSVNGLSVSSLDSAGVDLQMPACSPGNTGSSPQNPTQFELGDQGDLFRCPVKEDDNNDKETNLANEGDDQKPKKADRRPALVPCLKVLADFLAQRPPPTGRKKHANPAAGDTGRASTVAEMDSDKTCVGAVVEVVRKTDADSAGKTDYSNDMDWRISHSEETEGLDIKSFQEPREADKRPLVPRVSLVRLPVYLPPPGCPLPQFRLVPSANKQEVHLEQILEEDQSSLTKCPSQKLCRIRWPLKRKDPPLNCPATTSKRAKSMNVQGTTGTPPEDYHWNITEEIREECDKARPSEDRIKRVLKETFKTRRTWIDGQPPGKLLPICKPYPCFRLGTFIMYEFAMLLGGKKFDAIPQRAENFLNVMESMMGAQKEGELRMLPVLSMIEENTKFEREISASVITVCKAASPGDLQLNSRETHPPRLVLHVTDDSLLDAFIVGDTVIARAQANTVLDAVVTLLATYYTFHLQYPRIYSQALGFLQHHLLGDMYIGPKSNRFRLLSREFVKCRKKPQGPRTKILRCTLQMCND